MPAMALKKACCRNSQANCNHPSTHLAPLPMLHTRFLAAAFLLAITSSHLLAHSVWIEPLPDGNLALRFGEWGEEPETSPGHLDSLSGLAAATDSGALTPEKKNDHYLLKDSSADQSATGTAGYPVMKRGDAPARRPIFYARWWPASRPAVTAPANALDLLPTAGQPQKVLVSFHGKPVPAGVELTFYPPGEKEAKLTTDDTGHVTLPEAANAGLCLLTLGRHSEEAPGEFEGKPYAIASHSASLCWRIEKP